jgi:hypothetical protein
LRIDQPHFRLAAHERAVGPEFVLGSARRAIQARSIGGAGVKHMRHNFIPGLEIQLNVRMVGRNFVVVDEAHAVRNVRFAPPDGERRAEFVRVAFVGSCNHTQHDSARLATIAQREL